MLIHPQLYTLQQCMRNMLASFTKHRHIIHGGYTFAGSGSWVLNVRVVSDMDRIFIHLYICDNSSESVSMVARWL